MVPHPAELSAEQLLKECRIKRTRRSGPGGQHRNKVETAIEICHKPTGIQAEASEERSQETNKRMAIKRLRVKLALGVRQPERVNQLPDSFWLARFPHGRLKINHEHDDYPIALAEALDVLCAHQMELRLAAEQLNCSSSQLTHFLKLDPAVIRWVNKRRKELGYHVLK